MWACTLEKRIKRFLTEELDSPAAKERCSQTFTGDETTAEMSVINTVGRTGRTAGFEECDSDAVAFGRPQSCTSSADKRFRFIRSVFGKNAGSAGKDIGSRTSGDFTG